MSERGTRQLGYGALNGVRPSHGPVRWVWPQWVPAGHVTMIVGPSQSGKSYLAAHLIAALTGAQAHWPCGAAVERGVLGPVVLVDTEEAHNDYALRLLRLGVPLERVLAPTSDPLYVPSLLVDAARIAEVARAQRVAAVVVDGLGPGWGEALTLTHLQQTLAAGAGLAAELGVAVILVHRTQQHSLPMGDGYALEQVHGAHLIHRYARAVIAMYGAAYGARGSTRIEMVKSWFGAAPAPLGCTMGDEGLAFAAAPSLAAPKSALDMAADFLLEALEAGPVPLVELLARGAQAGHTRTTLYRARDILGVRGSRGQWWLPGHGELP